MNIDTRFERLSSLSARDLSKVHSRTVDILVNTGMWVESEKAREIFKKHGFRVDGEIVHFKEKAIEDAIESTPSKFTVIARNPKNNLELGGDNFSFGPSGGSPFYMEFNGVQRSANCEDVDNFLKLTEWYDVIGFNRNVVSPSDIPSANVTITTLLSSLKLTTKPYNISNEDSLNMVCIAFGITREKYKEDVAKGIYYGIGGINPVSPLSLNELQSDRLIFLAENRIPNVIATMPTAGISGPCTLPGLIIIQNCENLGAIVLSQLVNPGAPVLYGCIGTIMNMRTGGSPIGAPEARIIECAAAQIGRFYGIPTRGDIGLTDSLCCDFQAGAESALHFYNAVRAGIHYLPGCGELGSWNHGSLEKFVLDAEIAQYVTRLVKPMEFTEANMAVDLINKVGPRGSFITETHTLKNFRKEFYEPHVFSRVVYDKWDKEGRIEVKDKAHAKVKEILQKYERPALDPAIERDLDQYAVEHLPVK